MWTQLRGLFMRGPMFKIMVRDEVLSIIDEHGEAAHAYVVQKLKRTDLTTRYRIMLHDVERQLRAMHGRSEPVAH